VLRRVPHAQPRQEPELDGLSVTENAPEITACDAITVAIVASTTIGHQRPAGREPEERVLAADGSRSSRAPCPA
jgi:hypothetical protein